MGRPSLAAVAVLVILMAGRLACCSKREEEEKMVMGKNWEELFSNKFMRGPVPPSGPSLCHNKLRPRDHPVRAQEACYMFLLQRQQQDAKQHEQTGLVDILHPQ